MLQSGVISGLPVPRQQLGDFPAVIGDAGQDLGEVELPVEAVEFGGLDQRVHGGGAVAADVGTGEEIVPAAIAITRSFCPYRARS